jgi:TPR repeat protein
MKMLRIYQLIIRQIRIIGHFPFFMKIKILALTLLTTPLSLPTVQAQDASSTGANPDGISPSASSEYETGKNFLHGRGVEKNPEKALEYFQKAAELGHIEAPGAIGYFYSAGLVVEKDDSKAAEWFQKSSEKGSALSKFNLGRLYLDGKGGLSDKQKGVDLMEAAAALGLPEAHTALAEIYFLGLFNEQHLPDYTKAEPHVNAAAASGEPAAINMLGVMKQSGLGLEKDEKGAEDCFRRAAMKGDFKAPSNLGHLLNPESKNRSRRVEAAAWLLIAASHGEPIASRKIAELEQAMSKKDFSTSREKADKLQAEITGMGAN